MIHEVHLDRCMKMIYDIYLPVPVPDTFQVSMCSTSLALIARTFVIRKVRNLWWWCYPYFFRPRSCSALPSLAPWLRRITLLKESFFRVATHLFDAEEWCSPWNPTQRSMQKLMVSVLTISFSPSAFGETCTLMSLGGKRLFSGAVGCIKLVLSQFHPVETTIIHLVGGLEHFCFFHILGIILPID